MGRKSTNTSLAKRLHEYLRLAEANAPTDTDDRERITVRGVARALRVSPTTLYTHGFDVEINSAAARQVEAHRRAGRTSARDAERDGYRQQLRARDEDVSRLNAQMDALLAELYAVEVNAARLGLDPAELRRPIPKPDRRVSRAGASHEKRRDRLR